MSSSVAELEGHLQYMLQLKAPGVAGSKIQAITNLCVTNIQSESILIGKIYSQFKRAPPTHKLGVLYVIDAITRSWVEHARKVGQTPGPSAPDGTFAAGVNHVVELLPSIMSDMINAAPEDQKEKIQKLVDIWERGNTFPSAMLSSFKQKLNASNGIVMTSTTPEGTPPKDFIPLNPHPVAAAAPAQDTSAILKALADMAKTNTAPPGDPSPNSSDNVASAQNTFSQNVPFVNPSSNQPRNQAVGVPGIPSFGGPSNGPSAPQNTSSMNNAPPTMQAGATLPPGMAPEAFQQQIQILQLLTAQGVPQEQWGPVLAAVMAGGAAGPGTAGVGNPYAGPPPNWQQPQGFGGASNQSRDRNGFDDQHMRSPSSRDRRPRSRSRSPPGWDRRRDSPPPRRRDSPVYGDYRADADRDHSRNSYGAYGRGKGQGDSYRRRSPDRSRRSPSPRRQGDNLPPTGPKWIDFDRSLGEGMIKVLSRTLFVGGVTSSEDRLRAIFADFGLVQTCIVNTDKRHAFVKMVTRQDAMKAKEGMERFKSTEMQLRTKWGVGFGPRDCSDYATGVSIIPTERLTDADRKWMLTAEYGGTGGKPIESGMVVEEPDIEIGAGVSSKAISRRMVTDKGGHQGPRSERNGPSYDSGPPRYRQPEPPNRENNAIGVAPAVPGFGFQFPMMPNCMPMFPGSFGIPPGAAPTHPPPGAG